MTKLCRMAAAWCRNGTVQLLARTKILDHRVHFLTTIILVFICSHCCNFYFILILCPAISSGSRFHNINNTAGFSFSLRKYVCIRLHLFNRIIFSTFTFMHNADAIVIFLQYLFVSHAFQFKHLTQHSRTHHLRIN